MKTFDPSYRDFGEFLEGVTDAVWQQRGLAAGGQ